MTYETLDKNYAKTLLTDLFRYSNYIDQKVISDFFNEIVQHNDLDESLKYSEKLSKTFRIILDGLEQKKNKEQAEANQPIIVNGHELTRDYYSLRTEATVILGESAPTLNKRVNEGLLKCLPEFSTKKISKEELYNYHIKYQEL